METENTFYCEEFVIDKSQSSIVKAAEERIIYLFNVKLELKPAHTGSPKPLQWIHVNGTADDAKKAKEYILSLTSPVEIILVKNLLCKPFFTSQIQDEIERNSGAALTKCDNNNLKIQGTEFSVMLAQSMIDVMLSKTNADLNDIEIKKGDKERELIRREENLHHRKDMVYINTDFPMKVAGRDELKGSASLNKNNSSLTSVAPQPTSASTDAAAHFTNGFPISDLSMSVPFNKKIVSQQPSAQRKLFPHEIIGNSMYASASAICPRIVDTQINESSVPNFNSNGVTSTNAFHKVTHSGDGASSSASSHSQKHAWQSQLIGEQPLEVCNHDSIVGSLHLSPQAKDQQVYLRNLGKSLHYSSEDIEKGLACYNMDDVVKPREFLEMLNRIKSQRHGERHENNGTVSRDVSSNSHRPVKSVISANGVAKATASTEVSVLECNVLNEQLFRDIVSTVSNTAIQPMSESTTLSQQDHCDLDASVIFMGTTGNDTIVLSSDDEFDIPEEIIVRNPALPPDHPPPNHNNIVPLPSELMTTARRDPFVCGREVTMNRESVFEKENHDLPQRPIANRYLRYIIIDGSNVAMAHGDNKVFSVKGLRICIDYFVKRGHDKITAFVPEWRRYSENQTSIQGRALLDKLHNDGFIKFTPARRINGKTIASYDDRFILNLAEKEDGVIVSNDQFRDLCKERASYQNIVANRLLQFMFVGDHFMPPDDPLGRHGPHLDDFLRYPQQKPLAKINNGRESLTPKIDDRVIVDQRQANQRQPAPHKVDGKNNQPERNQAVTSELFVKLAQMFPEPDQAPLIAQVLSDHKRETDLNRLSNYCMNALFA